MVHNITKMVSLPHHSCSSMQALSANNKGMSFINGSGMGSVLLRKGGAGAASSYDGVDEYFKTTGIKPYAAPSSSGEGLPKSFSSKLSKLNIIPPTNSRRKNITMSM
jgi:hypothetical protein